MKKIFCSILLSLCATISQAAESSYPRMWVSNSDKATIQQKIKSYDWARTSYEALVEEVKPYVERHVDDPEWIVSRLAMYWGEGEHFTQCYLKNQNWDRGEGNAPVPTTRMPGMRTWNEYVNVPLEDRIPYNASGDMLGINKSNPDLPPVLVPYKQSGHMIRYNNQDILILAEKAAFIYWLYGDERYAKFATDIFNTWVVGTYYMNPILDPEESCGSAGGWAPGGICGYYDYEQIHDDLGGHAAVIYDFAYDYLVKNPHSHLTEINKTTPEVAVEVFKRFVDLGMVRGGKNGNWNVNGLNQILRPILVLESNDAYADGRGREYYLEFYTHKTTDYHKAIPDIVTSYDTITGLWPESPGYAFGVMAVLLEWIEPLKRAGIDIVESNPILEKSAMSIFPWTDDAGNMITFGDSRGGRSDCRSFENLLNYYTKSKNQRGIDVASSALSNVLENKTYSRDNSGWVGICSFVGNDVKSTALAGERNSYSPHHRMATMKNWNAPYKMMALLYGGRGNSHLSKNGLASQYYGYGYALANDASAYISYWSSDNGYHQSPTGCNTILPGYDDGEVVVNSIEPLVSEGEFTSQSELTPYVNFADMTANEKRRVVAMIQCGDGGYYVDIFRSDLEKNDYLFHNVGECLNLYTETGAKIEGASQSEFEYVHSDNYSYFKNIKKSQAIDDLVARWSMPEGITSALWIVGEADRDIYTFDSPSSKTLTYLTPGGVSTNPQPTPALIVRQDKANGWSTPFVTVYEAYKGSAEVVAIDGVSDKGDCRGVEVTLRDGVKDMILSGDATSIKGIDFAGDLGVIRRNGRSVEMLYLGCGEKIKSGSYSIEAPKDTYAAIYMQDGEWYYSASNPISVTLGKKKMKLGVGYNQKL